MQDNQGAAAPNGAPATSSSHPRSVPEISLGEARLHHILLAPRPARLLIQPRCPASTANSVATDRIFTIAVLGAPEFDVAQIDVSSLRFHHARPLTTALLDVNGDGVPDLVIQLRGAEVLLSPEASRARLTGWLKNTQIFVAEVELAPASNGASLAACTW